MLFQEFAQKRHGSIGHSFLNLQILLSRLDYDCRHRVLCSTACSLLRQNSHAAEQRDIDTSTFGRAYKLLLGEVGELQDDLFAHPQLHVRRVVDDIDFGEEPAAILRGKALTCAGLQNAHMVELKQSGVVGVFG